MNAFLQAISIFCFAMGGVTVMMFAKMNSINRMNDNYTFRQVVGLYFKREWAAYMMSLTFILVYAASYQQWIKLLTTSKYTANTIFAESAGLVWVFSFFVGLFCQWVLYKYLGKLEKENRNPPLPKKEDE
jgi:hypothetical protein